VYIGGEFPHVGGQLRHGLAAVDATTADVLPWTPVTSYSSALVATEADLCTGSGNRGVARYLLPRSRPASLRPIQRRSRCARSFPSLRARARPSGSRLPTTARVTLAVYDLQGRRVAVALDRSRRAAGEHAADITVAGWRAGCYFVRLQTDEATVTRKLVVLE
jgi:hypothetical protein